MDEKKHALIRALDPARPGRPLIVVTEICRRLRVPVDAAILHGTGLLAVKPSKADRTYADRVDAAAKQIGDALPGCWDRLKASGWAVPQADEPAPAVEPKAAG